MKILLGALLAFGLVLGLSGNANAGFRYVWDNDVVSTSGISSEDDDEDTRRATDDDVCCFVDDDQDYRYRYWR